MGTEVGNLLVPPELEAAVAARGVRIADWATAFTELKSEFDQAQANWSAAAREKEQLSARVNQLQVTIVLPLPR